MVAEIRYYSRTKSSSDLWETPAYFYALLNNEFQFTLDPCCEAITAKTEKYFTKSEDGLRQDWQGETVFVNPPFSEGEVWARKCYKEGQKEQTKVVMIYPPRTGTEYWHNYIMKAKEIRLCVGRVNFLLNGKPTDNANFPLCIIIFENHENKFPLLRDFHHKEYKKPFEYGQSQEEFKMRNERKFNRKITEFVEEAES